MSYDPQPSQQVPDAAKDWAVKQQQQAVQNSWDQLKESLRKSQENFDDWTRRNKT